MIWVTDYMVYLSVIFGIIIAWKGGKKEKKAAVLMIIGLILAPLVIILIRLFIQEPRPFLAYQLHPLINPPQDPSFPSGHATRMAIIAFSFMLARSRWTPLFLILMLIIGFTRVYVGVHYPIDVLGGFVTGFLITLGLGYLFNKISNLS